MEKLRWAAELVVKSYAGARADIDIAMVSATALKELSDVLGELYEKEKHEK